MSFQDVQIAFAGHNRPEDLDDSAAARASLDHAFRLLAEAGVRSGRLITGVADGADLLAAAAWNATGLGPTHAVYPFLRDPAADFPADHGRAETWLDGDSFEAGGRSAYLAQSRWLVESADILLAADPREDFDRYSPMVSRMLHLMLIDVLATAVAVQMGPELASRLSLIKRNLRVKYTSDSGD